MDIISQKIKDHKHAPRVFGSPLVPKQPPPPTPSQSDVDLNLTFYPGLKFRPLGSWEQRQWFHCLHTPKAVIVNVLCTLYHREQITHVSLERVLLNVHSFNFGASLHSSLPNIILSGFFFFLIFPLGIPPHLASFEYKAAVYIDINKYAERDRMQACVACSEHNVLLSDHINPFINIWVDIVELPPASFYLCSCLTWTSV